MVSICFNKIICSIECQYLIEINHLKCVYKRNKVITLYRTDFNVNFVNNKYKFILTILFIL